MPIKSIIPIKKDKTLIIILEFLLQNSYIRVVLNKNVYEKLNKNCTTEKLNTYLVDLERNNVPISKSAIKIALKDQAFFDNENILNIIKKNKFDFRYSLWRFFMAS